MNTRHNLPAPILTTLGVAATSMHGTLIADSLHLQQVTLAHWEQQGGKVVYNLDSYTKLRTDRRRRAGFASAVVYSLNKAIMWQSGLRISNDSSQEVNHCYQSTDVLADHPVKLHV